MRLLNKFLSFLVLAILAGAAFAQEEVSPIDQSMLAGIEGFLSMALNWAVEKFSLAGSILMAIGSLMVAGTAYVAATPSKEDDAKLAKLESKPLIGMIFRVIKAFSVIKPKDK